MRLDSIFGVCVLVWLSSSQMAFPQTFGKLYGLALFGLDGQEGFSVEFYLLFRSARAPHTYIGLSDTAAEYAVAGATWSTKSDSSTGEDTSNWFDIPHLYVGHKRSPVRWQYGNTIFSVDKEAARKVFVSGQVLVKTHRKRTDHLFVLKLPALQAMAKSLQAKPLLFTTKISFGSFPGRTFGGAADGIIFPIRFFATSPPEVGENGYVVSFPVLIR